MLLSVVWGRTVPTTTVSSKLGRSETLKLSASTDAATVLIPIIKIDNTNNERSILLIIFPLFQFVK